MTSTDDDYGQTSNTNNNNNNNNNNSINISTGNRRINSNNSNSHSSSNGIEIRILMTSRDAGAVIGMIEYCKKDTIVRFLLLYLGRGGSAIQKLRADHPRTIIQVPDCQSPERILIINGEHDQCFDALQQIIPILTDSSRLSSFNRRRNMNNNNTGGTTNSSEENSSSNDNQTGTAVPSEVRLLVHQIYCGAIIGKAGQHVKELRQTYNLDIKVFSQCCPMSHERIISLRGKVDDIIECVKVRLFSKIKKTQD